MSEDFTQNKAVNCTNEGVVRLGLSAASANVSSQVYSCILKRTHDAVEVPGSFASGRKQIFAGDYTDELVIRCGDSNGSSLLTVDSLVSLVCFADPPINLLFFEFIEDQDPVSANNHRYTGKVSVPQSQKGGENERIFSVSTLELLEREN